VTFQVLPEYEVDSLDWHEARRATLGASEVAAVLGLSKYQTPLTVYRAKMGVPNEIPENLAYFGRVLEPVIAQWVRDKHPEVGPVLSGFGAVNPAYPWLSATPDRVTDAAGVLHPLELKTSSEWSRKEWEQGVPDYYKIQSLVQQLVLGVEGGHLAVLHGGNRPELYEVPWDKDSADQIIDLTRTWWDAHVVARVAPDPTNYAEALEVYPGLDGETLEVSPTLFGILEQRDVDSSDMYALKKKLDLVKEHIALEVGNATVLTYQGSPVYNYARQNGSRQTDYELLQQRWPDAYAATVSQPRFPVLRRIKKKDSDE
jgi:putative phage-type endonuclease